MLRASKGRCCTASFPVLLSSSSQLGSLPTQASPKEALQCPATPLTGLEIDQMRSAGAKDRHDPFSAPDSLMGASMSQEKLTTMELDLLAAIHFLLLE